MKIFVSLLVVWILSGVVHAQQSGTTSAPADKGAQQAAVTPAQTADLEEAKQLNSKVVQLYKEGKYDEALPLAKRALALREKVLGAENQLIGSDLLNIAQLYLDQRRYEEAQRFFERCLKLYEKSFGPESPRLGILLDKIALTNFARSNDDATEKSYLRALAIREKAYGAESAEAGLSLSYLAEYYLIKGEFKKAEEIFKRLLPIRELKPGKNNEALVETLDRYGCTLRKLKREDEAVPLEKRSYTLLKYDLSKALTDAPAVMNGKALELPKPMYPEKARAARITGTVSVRVMINEDGRVIRACAISGPPELMQSSEGAAYGARFTPTKLSGVPVKVTGIITYNYEM